MHGRLAGAYRVDTGCVDLYRFLRYILWCPCSFFGNRWASIIMCCCACYTRPIWGYHQDSEIRMQSKKGMSFVFEYVL